MKQQETGLLKEEKKLHRPDFLSPAYTKRISNTVSNFSMHKLKKCLCVREREREQKEEQ
jgi:hypothetical protein